MKGIVLAGGTGSRLFPLTKITNKHLLPIYDKPMIYYPIQTLVDAGIRDILIVTGGKNSGDFLRLLANGKQFGLKHINYTYQEGEGGIADALALAEHFADGQKICVVLGDNIIEGNIRAAADDFRAQAARRPHPAEGSAPTPSASAWPKSPATGSSASRRSRAHPKSNYAVTGIYMYDATVFDKIQTLVPSGRGELEITDVNNAYIREGTMTFSFLDGWWTDAGTFDSLLRAANLVAQSAAGAQRSRLAKCGARDGGSRLPTRAWRPLGDLRTGASRVREGHRRRDRLARFARPDRRRARASRSRSGPTTAATSWKCSASATGWRRISRRAHAVSAALNYPGTIKAFHFHLHQTDCWTPVHGHVPGGAGGSARRLAHLRRAQYALRRARCGPGRS